MKHVADSEMVKNALGDEYDSLSEPPEIKFTPADHPFVPIIRANLREIYDPEIPVNIYELGLIYTVDINDKNDVSVIMTLTSPACPVAGEMPGWVQAAIFPIENVGAVDVDLTFDPEWNPSKMAETAKLELNIPYD